MFLLLTPSRGHGAHYRRRQAARRLPGCLSCTTPPQDFDPADLVYCQSINAYTKGDDQIKLNFKEDDPRPEGLEPLKISMAPLTCVQALDTCYQAIGTDNMCIPFNKFFSAEVRKLISQWKKDCRAAIKEEADKLRSKTQKVLHRRARCLCLPRLHRRCLQAHHSGETAPENKPKKVKKPRPEGAPPGLGHEVGCKCPFCVQPKGPKKAKKEKASPTQDGLHVEPPAPSGGNTPAGQVSGGAGGPAAGPVPGDHSFETFLEYRRFLATRAQPPPACPPVGALSAQVAASPGLAAGPTGLTSAPSNYMDPLTGSWSPASPSMTRPPSLTPEANIGVPPLPTPSPGDGSQLSESGTSSQLPA